MIFAVVEILRKYWWQNCIFYWDSFTTMLISIIFSYWNFCFSISYFFFFFFIPWANSGHENGHNSICNGVALCRPTNLLIQFLNFTTRPLIDHHFLIAYEFCNWREKTVWRRNDVKNSYENITCLLFDREKNSLNHRIISVKFLQFILNTFGVCIGRYLWYIVVGDKTKW